MQHQMLLVCHAADGHFADGNRMAVRHLLERAAAAQRLQPLSLDRYLLYGPAGSHGSLYTPGLDGTRSFHRIELHAEDSALVLGTIDLIYNLMALGGFGLLRHLDTCHFIVASPQQVHSFPSLPEPPRYVRDAAELAYVMADFADRVCA